MKARLGIALLAVLAACGPGGGDAPGPDRAGGGNGTPGGAGLPAPTLAEAAEAAAKLRARGELLGLACQACHSLNPGAAHIVGPNLSGIFGRPAATAPGFGGYSDALRASGIVWSPEILDRWLEDPAGFLPGTTMAFTGYRNPEDRAALIAFLVDATAVPPRN